MSLTLEQFGIDRLSPQERLELIGLIWDTLPDDVPFTPPDWHLRELERRVAAAARGAGHALLSNEEFEALADQLAEGGAAACTKHAAPATDLPITREEIYGDHP